MKNLRVSATNLSQVLFDTSIVESIIVENNTSFEALWKLTNPYQIVYPTSDLGPGEPLRHCSDTNYQYVPSSSSKNNSTDLKQIISEYVAKMLTNDKSKNYMKGWNWGMRAENYLKS